MPETLLPASSSGERRRAAQEAREPVRAWDPQGPASDSIAPALWDALRESVLWADAEWERVVEHAAGAEEATAHLAQLSAAIRNETAGAPSDLGAVPRNALSRRLLGLIRTAFIDRVRALPQADASQLLKILHAIEVVGQHLESDWSQHFTDRLSAPDGLELVVEVAFGERSGVAQIWVYDDGDNSIAVAPGAGAALTARHAQAAAVMLRGARVVMASCEVPFDATQAALQIAREGGALTLLNPAPARPLPEALLRAVDLLTPNESELHALAGTTDTLAASQALIARGPRAVLTTLGAQGCLLVQRDLAPLALPGRSMCVADTIGAGDTFTGALAAALARGESIESAARWANAAAALSVTGHGAIGGMPTRNAVAALLAQPPSET